MSTSIDGGEGPTELDVPEFRSKLSQLRRTLVHPSLDPSKHQPPTLGSSSSNTSESQQDSSFMDEHTFVVCTDTQFGMTSMNRDWDVEMEYSRQAVKAINAMKPRPLFCCVCGDLVDMTALIYTSTIKSNAENTSSKDGGGDGGASRFTEEDCDRIQDAQNRDFQRIWDDIHPDIALVCLCGNHDVGNRPTKASIERFTTAFGDDYLAWWANATYNIVVNTSLFSNPTDAPDLYEQQLQWLQEQLKYATRHNAGNIFVFGHHPWFLYREDETSDELTGESAFPVEWGFRADLGRGSEKDGYFHIPLRYRIEALKLFERYHVSAAFSGHFHQNLIATTSFGMEMIVTGPLSLVFESTGVPRDFPEPRSRGLRIVKVRRDINGGRGQYEHKFITI